MNSDFIGQMVEVSKDGKTWHKRKLLAIIKDADIKTRYITDYRKPNGTIRVGEISKWPFCKPLSTPVLMGFEQACSYIGKKCLFSDYTCPDDYNHIPSTLQEIIIRKTEVLYVAESNGVPYRYVFREANDEGDIFQYIDNQ